VETTSKTRAVIETFWKVSTVKVRITGSSLPVVVVTTVVSPTFFTSSWKVAKISMISPRWMMLLRLIRSLAGNASNTWFVARM
jgi:hypothetical protein